MGIIYVAIIATRLYLQLAGRVAGDGGEKQRRRKSGVGGRQERVEDEGGRPAARPPAQAETEVRMRSPASPAFCEGHCRWLKATTAGREFQTGAPSAGDRSGKRSRLNRILSE